MKAISDNQMAVYWTERAKALRQMRPVTPAEAAALAADHDRKAAQVEAEAEEAIRRAGEHVPDSVDIDGRIWMGRIAEARRRADDSLAYARLQRDFARAYKEIAAAPEGAALAASLAEAEQRASYYAKLAQTAAAANT